VYTWCWGWSWGSHIGVVLEAVVEIKIQ